MKHYFYIFMVCCISWQLCGAIPLSNLQRENGYPVLIPGVKKITPVKDSFSLTDKFSIIAPTGGEITTTVIREALNERFPEIKVVTEAAENADCRLTVTQDNMPESQEGYVLVIDKSGISISARSAKGLFYGAQTLANMIRNINSKTLKGCKITDWPSLKMRGVFFTLRTTKSSDIPALKKAFDVFAALKYNTLFLEFAENIPMKGNPFSKRQYTLTEKDIKEIASYAKERQLEIIPQFQILSHAAWINMHPDFKSMIEGKPDKAFWTSYCPSNPKAVKLALDVISRTVELLKPRYFNICVDELKVCPWRVCPKCKKRNQVELLGEHVKLVSDKVFELGCIPMLYQDTFFPNSMNKINGWKILDKYVDRRTVFIVWDYLVPPDENMAKYFIERGFPYQGLSYCQRLENVAAQPKLVAKLGGMGCSLSYWGFIRKFFQHPESTNHLAYASTALAAEYQWNTDAKPISQLTYDAAYEVRRLLDPNAPIRRPGIQVVKIPIAREINTEFGSDPEFPIFSKDDHLDGIKKTLADGPEKFHLITAPGGKFYGIALAGKANSCYASQPVTIPVGIKTGKLSFLLTCARPKNMKYEKSNSNHIVRYQPVIGELKINFSDGSDATIPLRYSFNINDWNAECGGYAMRFIFRGVDDCNSYCTFSVLDYNNPKPEKEIKSITFSTKQVDDIAPVLLAISAFDAKGEVLSQLTDAKAIARFKSLPEKAKVQTVFHDNICCNFENGMGAAKFNRNGKFSATPEVKVINSNSPNGNALRIVILAKEGEFSPGKDWWKISRVAVDVPLPPLTKGTKSLCFAYKTDHPEYISKSGCYIGDEKFAKLYRIFNFHNSYDKGWRTVHIPLTVMERKGKNFKVQDATHIRISFWVENPKPMTIYIDNIGISDLDANWRWPLRKAKTDK